MLKRIAAWIKRHPIWTAIIAVVILLIATSTIMSLLAPRDYEYISEKVETGEVKRIVSASGKLRALNTINVGAEVSGQITQVNVDYNSVVTAGQVLAVIDATRTQSRVQQGRASVAVAQASLQQAQSNISRARSDLTIQEREFKRRKTLADQGFLSKTALDQAEAQLISSRNALQVAKTQATSANAQISQANAQLSSSQLDLSRTRIIAPSSGIVINKLVEPGSTVNAGFQTPNLFEIAADITKMQVEASVDEADIGQIKAGQDVSFTVDSYPDEKFTAKVRQVRQAPVENQNVVSYLVIIDVANEEGKLLPGMTANVEIITAEKSDITRIPSSALRFRPRDEDISEDDKEEAKGKKDKDKKKDPVVYIATDDPYKPKKRKVKIGVAGDEYTEIIEGLEAGEKIIVRRKKTDPEDSDDASDDSSS